MKIALSQTNPTVGDVAGNTHRLLTQIAAARDAGAGLVVFPEQSILGYPAKDLLYRRDLIERNVAALDELAVATRGGPAALVGFAESNPAPIGRPLFNAAALLQNGRPVATWRKRLLPNYDVFDERRYFAIGPRQQPIVEFGGTRIGVTICEDMWIDERIGLQPIYEENPIGDLATAGAQIVFNLSASPFYLGKVDRRLSLLNRHARDNRIAVVYVNQVGGNDDILFDGASCVVLPDGRLAAQARSFESDLLLFDFAAPQSARLEVDPEGPAALHDALVMGIRDYLHKCGFERALLGLSGGIDSAVVAALATTALGPENVLGVALPSRYSSDHSLRDAVALASNLEMRLERVDIEDAHRAFERSLAAALSNHGPDATEENVQARIRGTILMALSNRLGAMLLTTGNKSELATGYCTLYGDMSGGLAPLSDVTKMRVYELARYINTRAGRELIPSSTLTKPPSAELRPNQTDQDTLPPYDILDSIVERYDERQESIDQIVSAGFEEATVHRVVRMIQLSEHKRQQAPVGLKVTPRAFGSGRRLPIAARW